MAKKNPAAVALGKLGGKARMDKMTADEREEVARSGGAARAATLTAKQRSDAARKAAEARWSKMMDNIHENIRETKKLAKKSDAALAKLERMNAAAAKKRAKKPAK
jgi:hypothetical protein